jgi:hypothetical protein
VYNKSFSCYLRKITPTSDGIGAAMKTGLIIDGIVRKQKAEIFNDVQLGENKPGLEAVLKEGLPIYYPVKLLFTARIDTVLWLDKDIEVACDLEEIKIGKPDDEELVDVEIKISVEDASSDEIGSIVSLLKHTVPAQIKSTQEELFK